MTREEILNKAKECVCGQREQDYGTPESNFQLIADLWNDYLGTNDISPTDVAMMMALLKIARSKQIDIRDLQNATDRSILEKYFNCSNCRFKMKRGSEEPCNTCLFNCESPWPDKKNNWEKKDD